jgi:hypothetical protein
MKEEIKPTIEFSPDQIYNNSEVIPAKEVISSENRESQSPATQTTTQEQVDVTEPVDQPALLDELDGIEPYILNDQYEKLIQEKVYASSSELKSVADARELMDLANSIEDKPTEQEARDRLNQML